MTASECATHTWSERVIPTQGFLCQEHPNPWGLLDSRSRKTGCRGVSSYIVVGDEGIRIILRRQRRKKLLALPRSSRLPVLSHRLLFKEHIPAPHLPHPSPPELGLSLPSHLSHPHEACLSALDMPAGQPEISPHLPNSPAGVWPSCPGRTVH